VKIVREIGDHFSRENSAEFYLTNGFSTVKIFREIDPRQRNGRIFCKGKPFLAPYLHSMAIFVEKRLF
jgi:hypothetical protein